MAQASNLTDGVPQSAPFDRSDAAALLRALCTLHSGASRPAVLGAGGENEGPWIEKVSSAEWNLRYWDGNTDILILTINPTLHTCTFASRSSGEYGLVVVRTVALTNVAIETDIKAGDAINGVTLAPDDLVLLTAQTAPAENGVYVAAASGAASRHLSLTTYDAHCGRVFSVQEGTNKHDTLWICTSNRGGVLGATDIVISEIQTGESEAPGIVQSGSSRLDAFVGSSTVHVTQPIQFVTVHDPRIGAASKLLVQAVNPQALINGTMYRAELLAVGLHRFDALILAVTLDGKPAPANAARGAVTLTYVGR